MIGELRARLVTLAFASIIGSLVATSSPALAAAVHVCGTVATYTAAHGEQEGVLSLRTSQATFTYLLSGGGSRGPRVEPAAVAPGASACVSGELVLSARPPSHEVLIDFEIVVPAGGLPNTSTADHSPSHPPLAPLTAVLTLDWPWGRLGSTSAGQPTPGDTVHACGILTSFTAPSESNNVGPAVIDNVTYYLSGTPGPTTLAPDVRPGRSVCLTGMETFTETGPVPLIIRWTLVLNPAVSPTPASATPTQAATTAAVVATATPSDLPTVTGTGNGTGREAAGRSDTALMLAFLALLLIVAGAVAFVLRRGHF